MNALVTWACRGNRSAQGWKTYRAEYYNAITFLHSCCASNVASANSYLSSKRKACGNLLFANRRRESSDRAISNVSQLYLSIISRKVKSIPFHRSSCAKVVPPLPPQIVIPRSGFPDA